MVPFPWILKLACRITIVSTADVCIAVLDCYHFSMQFLFGVIYKYITI